MKRNRDFLTIGMMNLLSRIIESVRATSPQATPRLAKVLVLLLSSGGFYMPKPYSTVPILYAADSPPVKD